MTSRLGIISDVHADIRALRDALVQIERLGCDGIVCAGDVVDYGLFPEETIGELMARDIPTVLGNHDRHAVQESRFNSIQPLSSSALGFLRRLPIAWGRQINGVRVAVHHGSPGCDTEGIHPNVTDAEVVSLLDAASCDVLIVGHTHLAFARHLSTGRLVCNPGPLLRDAPRFPGVPARGTFGVLELPSCTFSVHEAATGRIVGHLQNAEKSSQDASALRPPMARHGSDSNEQRDEHPLPLPSP